MAKMDRKTLLKKMHNERVESKKKVKGITYPLPSLTGPGGNALSLMALASDLMVKNGVSDSTVVSFTREAMSKDYQHLLKMIQEWFTVVIPKVEYIPLADDTDITSLIPQSGYEMTDDDDDDPDVQKALDDYAVNAEERERVDALQNAISKQMREELGLKEDDVVIVQVKKRRN